jgi:hypothetical protein
MPIANLQLSPIDKLWILWAICLVAHYQENDKKTSAYNIRNEFGDLIFEYWKTGCEMAEYHQLLDCYTMRLTPKGQRACANWQLISAKICSF